jgi:hypothetical protein
VKGWAAAFSEQEARPSPWAQPQQAELERPRAEIFMQKLISAIFTIYRVSFVLETLGKRRIYLS